ncbi:MAG: hypothetical protein CR993_04555 [Rhodobacterales bacterium]|nr:MAG: hypothetical protein CR993_04555 [Rhodobacterales bacterium]
MALAFDHGPSFAFDKAAGTPCPNLAPNFTCTIHETLAQQGFPGCTRYDCKGAGQRISTEVFPHENWRDTPSRKADILDAFATLRRVHEGLELIQTAEKLPLPADKRAELAKITAHYLPETPWTPESLARFDADHLPTRLATFLRSLAPLVPRSACA